MHRWERGQLAPATLKCLLCCVLPLLSPVVTVFWCCWGITKVVVYAVLCGKCQWLCPAKDGCVLPAKVQQLWPVSSVAMLAVGITTSSHSGCQDRKKSWLYFDSVYIAALLPDAHGWLHKYRLHYTPLPFRSLPLSYQTTSLKESSYINFWHGRHVLEDSHGPTGAGWGVNGHGASLSGGFIGGLGYRASDQLVLGLVPADTFLVKAALDFCAVLCQSLFLCLYKLQVAVQGTCLVRPLVVLMTL